MILFIRLTVEINSGLPRNINFTSITCTIHNISVSDSLGIRGKDLVSGGTCTISEILCAYHFLKVFAHTILTIFTQSSLLYMTCSSANYEFKRN